MKKEENNTPIQAAVAAAQEIYDADDCISMTVDTIAATIAAIIDRAASAGWQPIETAPKDGTWILLLHENHSTPTVGRWIDGGWFSDDGLKWPSTHWMTLPPPPSAPSPTKQI